MKQQCKICEGTGFYGGGKTECVICSGTGEVNPITGEDVAALLHGIHEHGRSIAEAVRAQESLFKRGKITDDDLEEVYGEIYYPESSLLPVLEALGLPAPIWGKNMSVEEFKEQRS